MTPLEMAQAELSDAMVPWPDDYLDDLTPPAAFLVLRQAALVCLKVATGAAASLVDEGSETQPVADEVLNGIAAAVAGSTHALVALGVLPQEAEVALEGNDNAGR